MKEGFKEPDLKTAATADAHRIPRIQVLPAPDAFHSRKLTAEDRVDISKLHHGNHGGYN